MYWIASPSRIPSFHPVLLYLIPFGVFQARVIRLCTYTFRYQTTSDHATCVSRTTVNDTATRIVWLIVCWTRLDVQTLVDELLQVVIRVVVDVILEYDFIEQIRAEHTRLECLYRFFELQVSANGMANSIGNSFEMSSGLVVLLENIADYKRCCSCRECNARYRA
jgi:hypothetical protein